MNEKQRILVVDDDKDLRESVASYLGARGYEVVTASSGTEAVARIDERVPDLLVLDVMMDYDAEGLNLAYKLQNDERTRKLPIVILSGFLKELDKKYEKFEFIQGRDWPAAKMFEKPVKLSELAESIANLLKEKKSFEQMMLESGA